MEVAKEAGVVITSEASEEPERTEGPGEAWTFAVMGKPRLQASDQCLKSLYH